MNMEDAKHGKPIGPRVSLNLVIDIHYHKIVSAFNHVLTLSGILQEYSYWLYNVPWGMYKALTYIKERYGNPTVFLSENGNTGF